MRTLKVISIILILILACMLTRVRASAAPAALEVTNTNDSGAGSLRQAILDADATNDIIDFNIAGPGVHIIHLTQQLIIATDLTIDGYSQPGAHPNTLAQGTNAVISIELDGSALPANDSIFALTYASTIKGLAMNNAPDDAVTAVFGGGLKLQGDFIGTDATGTVARPNGVGVATAPQTNGNQIGGSDPASRNLISGNRVVGVDDNGGGDSIRNNLIGTDPSGMTALPNGIGVAVADGFDDQIVSNEISGNQEAGIVLYTAIQTQITQNAIGLNAAASPLGNGGDGILIEGNTKKARIGGPGGDANRIAFNTGAGIRVTGAHTVKNLLSANQSWSNGGLGIDLGMNGITPNDAGDLDQGPNLLQNFPRLLSADNVAQHVHGKINTAPNMLLTIEFFQSAAGTCDSSGNGEGTNYLGSVNVTTNPAGKAKFNFVSPTPFHAGDILTSTATAASNTSEFSKCLTAR